MVRLKIDVIFNIFSSVLYFSEKAQRLLRENICYRVWQDILFRDILLLELNIIHIFLGTALNYPAFYPPFSLYAYHQQGGISIQLSSTNSHKPKKYENII